MRRYIFIILFAMLVVMLAACTDDPPRDTRGCIAEEGQTADEVYNFDDGCVNGTIVVEEGHGEEGEHADDAHSDEVEGEDHSTDAENADQTEGSDTTSDHQAEGDAATEVPAESNQ